MINLINDQMKKFRISPTLEFFFPDDTSKVLIPLINTNVQAGFPSLADDFIEDYIDLNKEYIKNKASTFMVRVNGNSMIDAGIGNEDLLIVDKSIKPTTNKIAVCYYEGGYIVKRLRIEDEVIWLMPENYNYFPIKITPEAEFLIWGVVTTIIKKV